MTNTLLSDAEAIANPRRQLLSGLGSKLGMGAAVGAAALGGATLMSRSADAATVTDADIVNFALNFEYLGAQYYLHAVVGQSLPSSLLPSGSGTVTVPSTTLVPFANPAIAYYGIRLGADEQAHVGAFQSLVTMLGGTPIAQPNINLDTNGSTGAWSIAAQAAGLVGQGQSFNPYESDVTFMLGAYVLEDVCITALVGAAGLLTNPMAIMYAAKAIGVEATQAGAIRGYLSRIGAGVATDAISNLRSTLSGVGDNGTSVTGNPYRFANLNDNSIAFGRAPEQVLAIAYGGTGKTSGLFFPSGVQGAIAPTSAST